MPNISPIHLVIVLIIALIVIGPGKLPEVGAALGKSIKEFRKAASDITDSAHAEAAPIAAATAVAAAPVAPPPAAAPVTYAPAAPVYAAHGSDRRGATADRGRTDRLSRRGRPATWQRVAEPRVRVLARASDAGRRTPSDDRGDSARAG